MRTLTAKGTKLSFDPNIRRELLSDDSVNISMKEVMMNTYIFLPGVEELLIITGAASIEAGVEKCFHLPNTELVLLKNGAHSSKSYQRNSMIEIIGICAVVQADATGVGDRCGGAFLRDCVKAGLPAKPQEWVPPPEH